jgi:hypothetical protein
VNAPLLRPLGIGEILDVAIKITTRHWWTLVRIVLIVVVPLELLSALVNISAADGALSGGGDPGFDESGQIDTDAVWVFGAALTVAFLLSLLGQTLATGACFKAVADAYLGREPTWRRSLAETVKRLHSIVWVSVLTYVLGFLGLVACIVPGIWLFVAWTVAVPALLTEGVKGRKALGRSFRLVRDYWWRTFALVFLGTLLASIVAAALVGVLTGLAFTAESDLTLTVAEVVATIVAGLITTPFIAAMTIVLYIDLRVRKEGFDLALLAERFGEPGDGAAAIPLPAAPVPLPPARPTGGSQPPYWPPPPGWRPDGDDA